MRRPGPRPLDAALREVLDAAGPATPLARVQRAWPAAAGAAVAAEARPVAERAGTVTVECSSAAWAQELELLSRDILGRLQEVLGDPSEVRSLRFVAGRRVRGGDRPGGHL